MRKSKFTEQQIAFALRQAETGKCVAEGGLESKAEAPPGVIERIA